MHTEALDGSGPTRLCGPNDLVFDASGEGFWFTDHGKNRARDKDVVGVFYAATDGSSCREVGELHLSSNVPSIGRERHGPGRATCHLCGVD